MTLYLTGPLETPGPGIIINTTSRSTDWGQEFSPFFLGPIDLYGGYTSLNMENAWQYSKVYQEHVDQDNNPTLAYWIWANTGWKTKRANRYPMGKGKKPLYSLWDNKRYSYLEARKEIYIKLYSQLVIKTKAYSILKNLYKTSKEDIYLWDFDGYNHKKLGMTYEDAMNHPKLKMGHAFVIAMLIEGIIS